MTRIFQIIRTFFRQSAVITGALALTLAFFLVLPLMQTISKGPAADTVVQSIDTANLPPPPPPPPEEEEPEEEEPEEQPPELTEQAPPLDLSQLELALNPGFGGDGLGGDFAVKLDTAAAAAGEAADALFSMSDLDQKPRAVYQISPNISASVRKKTPGTVHIIFIVDERGKVENPIVQSSTDVVFEAPALSAVKQWRFEPGKRNGQPVRFRMRVPVTFPKGQ